MASPKELEVTAPLNEDTQKLLRWSVGVVDADFGATRDDFRRAIKEAVICWEQALGEKLFEYDPINGMPINLLVNDVTKKLTENRKLDAYWHELNAYWHELNAKREELNTQLNPLKEVYDEAKVIYYEEKNLYDAKSHARLRADRLKLNAWAKEFKVIIDPINKINDSMRAYSSQMNNIRDAMIAATPKERGIYSVVVFQGGDNESINIYYFSSGNYLISVVMHELGHALGFRGHVSDPAFVMYYAGASDQEPVLTEQDINAVKSHLKYGKVK